MVHIDTVNVQPAFYGKKKKKKKLVKRALEHKDAGRIKQGTFGEFEIQEPGTASFRGCAIGCLSQPIKKSVVFDGFTNENELSDWLRQHGIRINANDPDYGNKHPYEYLVEKFNFSYLLCGVIDAVFECLPAQDAKNWPSDIIRAISVGQNVSNEAIAEILDQHKNTLGEIMGARYPGFSERKHWDEYYSPPTSMYQWRADRNNVGLNGIATYAAQDLIEALS